MGLPVSCTYMYNEYTVLNLKIISTLLTRLDFCIYIILYVVLYIYICSHVCLYSCALSQLFLGAVSLQHNRASGTYHTIRGVDAS